MNEEKAQERIEELKGYYAHLGAFVPVNLFLIAINLMDYSESDGYWFVYPLFGWGIGLCIHTLTTFFTGNDWEERKMQELTGWSVTQEELQRMSERTDNLISILSSVDWEKIDPDLLDTKENLLRAREQIVDMRDGNGAPSQSKSEVIRELEKLEEFVTSSKFSYYDQAANDTAKR
jgi:hypothetical protein